MAWETWTLFLVTDLVLCLTPGPAVLLVLSQALARGAVASLWSSAGILGCNALYFVLSATSLGALILASYDLFAAVRWVGAAYLIALGLATFLGRHTAVAVTPADGAAERGSMRLFLDGVVLQAANPKALVFFTALLPQFIDPRGDVARQVAILGATNTVVEFCVLATYGALAARATTLARRPRFARITNRVAGSLLVGAGIGTAAARH